MKLSVIILTILMPCTLLAQNAPFTINGQVGKLNGVKAYLCYRQDGKALCDSSDITDGKFTFKGSVREPIQSTIIVNYPGYKTHWENVERKNIYLEPGDLIMEGKDSFRTAKVSGKINEDYEELSLALKPSAEENARYMARYNATPPAQRKDSAVQDEFRKQYNAFANAKRTIYVTFIKSHGDNVVSLDALKELGGKTIDYNLVAPLFNSFSDNVKNSLAGREYGAMLAPLKTTAIGSMAPEFSLKDTLGHPVALSSYRGKYVLVDFWSSYCGPCRAENPNIVKMYAKFHPKGFEILGVSFDEKRDRQNWLSAIHHDGLTWQQVSNLTGWDNEAAKLYFIRLIPQNVLLDPNGRIIAKNLRGEALGKKLSELFPK